MKVLRGQIYLADLQHNSGSEQGGIRPVLVIQNNVGNKFSPTIIVVPITSKSKKYIPTHIDVGTDGGLVKDSLVLCEQISVLDKRHLIKYIGTLSQSTMDKINQGICISLQLNSVVA